MPDIIIVGGLAVLPTGPETVDIGVDRGRIVAIGAPGSLAGGANRTIDASGQIVIPGGIDPHVHCRWPIVVPGVTQHQMTDGPAQVSRAALHGGTCSRDYACRTCPALRFSRAASVSALPFGGVRI